MPATLTRPRPSFLKFIPTTLTGRVCLAVIVGLIVVVTYSTTELIRQARAVQATRLSIENHMAIENAVETLELDLSKVQVAILNYKLTSNPDDLVQEKLFSTETVTTNVIFDLC